MYKHQLFPLFTLIAAGGGFALNHQLHTVAVNPDTFLIRGDSPIPMMLLGLTVLVAAILLFLLLPGRSISLDLESALSAPPSISIALWTAGGVLLPVGAGPIVMELGLGDPYKDLSPVVQSPLSGIPIPLLIGIVLSIPACVGLLVLCKHLSHNTRSPHTSTMTLFPAFATLPWLLYCYQENTRNPAIALYGYQLLGLAAAATALYLLASLAYGQPRPKTTAYCSLMGVYLLLSSLTLGAPLYFSVTLMAFALILLGNAIAVLKNIYAPSIGKRIDSQKGTN